MTKKQLEQKAVEYLDNMFVDALKVSKDMQNLEVKDELSLTETKKQNKQINDMLVIFNNKYNLSIPEVFSNDTISLDVDTYIRNAYSKLIGRDHVKLEKISQEKPYNFPIRDKIRPHQLFPSPDSES